MPAFDPPIWLRRWWLKQEIRALSALETKRDFRSVPWLEILPSFSLVALLLGVSIFIDFKLLPAELATIFVVALAGPPAIYLSALFWGWGRESRAISTWPVFGRRAISQVAIDAFALRQRRQAELDRLTP